MTRSVHIFDVCGTLFLDDTTVGFIRWYHRRKKHWCLSALLALLFERRSPLKYLAVLAEKVAGRHLVKHVAIWTLKNEEMGALEGEADHYVEHLISARSVPQMMNRLRELKKQGSFIVLASASINPVVKALATRLEVAWVSSEIGVNSGRATGSLCVDISGKKIGALQVSHCIDFSEMECHGYSDNLSDLRMLELCTHRTVVVHKPRHLKRWVLEGARFIKLYQDFDGA